MDAKLRLQGIIEREQRNLEWYQNGAANRRIAIDEAKQQLAELNTPKLRHGDYGFDHKGRPCFSVNLYSDGTQRDVGFHGVYDDCDCAGPTDKVETKIGNILDNLKAMSEPLDEFKIKADSAGGDGFTAEITGKFIKLGCRRYMFDIIEVIKIHQKLGRLIATAKRKAAEKC